MTIEKLPLNPPVYLSGEPTPDTILPQDTTFLVYYEVKSSPINIQYLNIVVGTTEGQKPIISKLLKCRSLSEVIDILVGYSTYFRKLIDTNFFFSDEILDIYFHVQTNKLLTIQKHPVFILDAGIEE